MVNRDRKGSEPSPGTTLVLAPYMRLCHSCFIDYIDFMLVTVHIPAERRASLLLSDTGQGSLRSYGVQY